MRSLSAKVISLALVSFALPGLLGRAAARTDGGVPKLDVAQSCRQAQTIGGDDKNLAYKGCMQDEKDAQDQLTQRWSRYKAEDRRNCIEQGAAPMPSYVEILTCIEMYDGSSTFNRPVTDSGSLGASPAPAASPLPAPPDATGPADSGGGLKF
jgi:hypothetical protein